MTKAHFEHLLSGGIIGKLFFFVPRLYSSRLLQTNFFFNYYDWSLVFPFLYLLLPFRCHFLFLTSPDHYLIYDKLENKKLISVCKYVDSGPNNMVPQKSFCFTLKSIGF